jgi:uncharacterized protein YodC (DUF2158 family)
MAEAFGIGDIVTLKSGSCNMTVEGFEIPPAPVHPHTADRLIRCIWMADGMIQSHVFAPHLLVGEKKTEPEKVREDKAASKELVAA